MFFWILWKLGCFVWVQKRNLRKEEKIMLMNLSLSDIRRVCYVFRWSQKKVIGISWKCWSFFFVFSMRGMFQIDVVQRFQYWDMSGVWNFLKGIVKSFFGCIFRVCRMGIWRLIQSGQLEFWVWKLSIRCNFCFFRLSLKKKLNF